MPGLGGPPELSNAAAKYEAPKKTISPREESNANPEGSPRGAPTKTAPGALDGPGTEVALLADVAGPPGGVELRPAPG